MVNTFIPRPGIKKSLKTLDYRRLGKQRVEAFQILNILENVKRGCQKFPKLPFAKFLESDNKDATSDPKYIFDRMEAYKNSIKKLRLKTGEKFGFASHSVVVMWVGYTDFLKKYINASIKLWIKKGYKNTMKVYEDVPKFKDITKPWWFGYEPVHASHRASLCEKEPSHYVEQFGNLEFTGYIWPSHMSLRQIKQTVRSISFGNQTDGTTEYILDKLGFVKIEFVITS